jgi:hypothetical protein
VANNSYFAKYCSTSGKLIARLERNSSFGRGITVTDIENNTECLPLDLCKAVPY